ncbi:hypothetical protein FGO68_gene8050 [Halteria grandinella]|uniref:Uncharacterized protein n=1 Tax=Halteria grandinella TaxID=5974 RepID=A0A8J8NX76_HALGN|nr:hypothetical protein FGO68_gene8050 [Halteria grandinella]
MVLIVKDFRNGVSICSKICYQDLLRGKLSSSRCISSIIFLSLNPSQAHWLLCQCSEFLILSILIRLQTTLDPRRNSLHQVMSHALWLDTRPDSGFSRYAPTNLLMRFSHLILVDYW